MKTLIKLIGLATFVFAISLNTFAGNDRKLWREAENYLIKHEYAKANANYQKIYEKNQENYNMAFKIGFCYLHTESLDDVDLAINYLNKAQAHIDKSYKDDFNEKNAPVETEYFLGVAHRLKGNYQKAIDHFKAYKAFKKRNTKTLTDALIDSEIESCEYSIANPPENYKVTIYNFDVTTPEETYIKCPVVSGNDSVFVYILSSVKSYLPDVNVDRETFDAPFDKIYYSTLKDDNTWTDPKEISTEMNMNGYTMPVSLSYDGKTLLMVRDDKDNGNIYQSELKEGKWSRARKLNSNINSGKWETHAYLSKDSQKLYFTSARSTTKGKTDLYVSEKNDNGSWGPAKNLSGKLNTLYFEDVPFFLEDRNQLYFASEGHGTMGGFDMFVSSFDSVENEWTKPINLGYPYNTVGSDLAYIVEFQGKLIYCPQNSSKRRANVEASDCFTPIRVRKEGHVDLVGRVFIPELNNAMPNDLELSVIDTKSGKVLRTLKPNADGSFYVESIPIGRDYKITATSTKIIDDVTEFSIPADYDKPEYPVDIYLFTKDLVLDVTVFTPDLNNVIPEDLRVKLIEKESGKVIGTYTPDENRNFKVDGIKRGKEYMLAASSEQVIDKTTEISIPLDYVKPVYFTEIYLYGKGEEIVFKYVLFDFDKYNIKDQYIEDLNYVADFMKKYDDFKIEIQGHTDHFGSDEYNIRLGERRATSVRNYLIKQGVKEENISFVTYGETTPIAKELDTNDSRRFNRRAIISVKSKIDGISVRVEDVPVLEQYKINN